jgi:alkaline phosphatase
MMWAVNGVRRRRIGDVLDLLRDKSRKAALMLPFLAVLVLLGADAGQAQDDPGGGEARNVILFIGDGMGTSHRDAVHYATVGPGGELAMEAMPYAGMSRTAPDDPEAFVTDSAAGGTAIASGVKTFNGAVGVDADENAVPTVLERARQAGKATGLVTDSQVTDATPASFGAHVPDRSDQSEIARQYLEESEPDVILGGGEDYWYPEEDPEEKSEGTEGDLVRQAQEQGYEYVSDAAGLRAATGPKILGLFANQEMFQQNPEGEGDVFEPPVPLTEMTSKAIETLSQDPEGFFLVVEEEAIDEMAHQGNARLTIEAGQRLDEAVEVGKAFAEKEPGTLVVVTADHETASMALEDTNEVQSDPDYPNESGEARSAEDGPFPVADSDLQFLVDWTTTNHTAEDVPVTAMGPGGENLVGVYDNTHIHDVMLTALGLSAAPAPEAQQMPGTGGPKIGTTLWLALAALLVGAGVAGILVRRRAA